MVLHDIISYKRALVEQKIETLLALENKVHPSERDFYQALKNNAAAFICEIKLQSPSQGVIRTDTNISEIARVYAPFADAISVLADEKFFGGSLTNVQKISREQACPVLCKDIIVSPLQVYEARYFGAHAVLLMLSVLDDKTYRECEVIAHKLKMAVICEVHTEEEMKRAVLLKANIIGINNRNLKTLEIDLATTERLQVLAPKDVMIISESGFVNHQQVYRYKNKVDGFLVGTSLMRHQRIDLGLRELIFGRVKICGITNPADARAAYECGAYYGGVNFSKHSPRSVALEYARAIMAEAPLLWGGVFVNQPVDDVIKIARELKLNFVQLSGDEEKDYIRQLRPDLPSECGIWQAIRIKDQVRIEPNLNVELFVLDNRSEHSYGGTGKAFDWRLLENLSVPFALAGGINPHNANRAESYLPLVLDIASGVEENNPRKKSLEKMRELFFNLRNKKEDHET